MKPSILIIIITLLLLFPAALFAEDGGQLFEVHCSGCHGTGGEGGRAPALRKTGLLITVEQGYFVKSIRRGREVRACPSFKDKISSEGIEAIASHIKSWQTGKMLDAPAHDVKAMYTEKGERLFALCGGCHGLDGEGAMGPPLLDPGFLESISDTELRRTIMHGRPGTPMKGFLKGKGVFATLSLEDIDGIISYMRYRQAAGGIKGAQHIKTP